MPAWGKDPKIGNRLINARVETRPEAVVACRFGKRRAVIPARGYYEWSPREHDGTVRKQPCYLHPPGDEPVAFAGLYELWRDPDGADDDPSRWLWSVVIITTEATGSAGEVHERTPLILPAERIGAWLDPHRADPDQNLRVCCVGWAVPRVRRMIG